MRYLLQCSTMFLALIVLCACGSSRDKVLYPVSQEIQNQPQQHRDFVNCFLQGKWCQAQDLYLLSIDGAIRRDAFCEAAQTARLAKRLKAYIGVESPELERAAEEYTRMGLDCELQDEGQSRKDLRYKKILDTEDDKALLRALRNEDDSLYASVYARKAARRAINKGQTDAATDLTNVARQVDSKQGWVVFLLEDWRLLKELETDPQRTKAIDDRIQRLEQQIEPCP